MSPIILIPILKINMYPLTHYISLSSFPRVSQYFIFILKFVKKNVFILNLKKKVFKQNHIFVMLLLDTTF